MSISASLAPSILVSKIKKEWPFDGSSENLRMAKEVVESLLENPQKLSNVTSLIETMKKPKNMSEYKWTTMRAGLKGMITEINRGRILHAACRLIFYSKVSQECPINVNHTGPFYSEVRKRLYHEKMNLAGRKEIVKFLRQSPLDYVCFTHLSVNEQKLIEATIPEYKGSLIYQGKTVIPSF